MSADEVYLKDPQRFKPELIVETAYKLGKGYERLNRTEPVTKPRSPGKETVPSFIMSHPDWKEKTTAQLCKLVRDKFGDENQEEDLRQIKRLKKSDSNP